MTTITVTVESLKKRSSNTLSDFAQIVGAASGLTPEHGGRIATELTGWAATATGSTWACEAGGLRLRAGVSVPLWTTADFRGRYLAVRGTDEAARRELIRRLADVAVDEMKWTGLRCVVHPKTSNVVMVSLASDGKSLAQDRDLDRAKMLRLRAATDAKWHMPRTLYSGVTQRATLHWSDPKFADHPCELGAGPFSSVLEKGEAILAVVPEPDASDSEVFLETARAVAAARSCVPSTVIQVKIEVARFSSVANGSAMREPMSA